MNNSVCSVCGKEFEVGVGGVFSMDDEQCDSCAGIVRTVEGYCYDNAAPYQVYRPLNSGYKNSARACPGDTVRIHPHRKVKHA